jgi:hypothetical protein
MKNILQIISLVLLFHFTAFSQSRIYTPALVSPDQDAVGQMPDALLDWEAVTGDGTEITYDLQLAQTSDFSNAVNFPGITVTALNMSQLKFKEKYFWRVRAHDANGVSAWSESRAFTVVSTVTITAPANQSIQNPDPTVKWNTLTGVTFYDIQIDTAYSWRVESSGVTSKLNDVFVLDANNSWAVGDGGLILHKTNNIWTSFASGVTSDLTDVFFVDAEHGWATGESGTILAFDGTAWTPMTSGVTVTLNGLFFTSATNGYAVGNTGKALHFDGTSWTAVTTGITVDIYAVHGLDSQHIWVVGKSGNYSFFNGTTWANATMSTRDLLGVWAVSTTQVVAAAKAGRIYTFDGTTWTETNSGTSKDYYDVCFLDANNGYIVGKSGSLLYFNGSIWKSAASGTTQDLNGIYLKDATTGFLVGNTGIVVSFQGEGFNSPYLKSYTAAGTILTFQFSNLVFGKSHYFRMRARHALSTSDWSPANSFFVVASPELNEPVNNSVAVALDTLVSWDVMTGVVKYGVQLSTDAAFTDPLYSESSTGEARFSGLVFGQDYFWRVNARHAAAVSEWSEPFKFTTINTVLLVSPENNATEVVRLPRYTWDGIAGAEKFQVQVSKNSNFTNAESNIVTTNHFQTMYSLDKQTGYYWRVQAIQGLDSTNWSETRYFTTTGETSIEEPKNQTFTLYPNPSEGQFTLTLKVATSEIVKVEIYNLLGNSVFEDSFIPMSGELKKHFDLRGNLRKGIYLVRLYEGSKVYTQKLTIE